MEKQIKLTTQNLKKIREVDSRLMSYNIEMTEVTGGTFWKAYTPEQIAGTSDFKADMNSMDDFTSLNSLMQYYPPINLYNENLRKYAKALGPVRIRVSGTWATKTYYDFEGMTNGKPPKGYASVLTKEQWIGVLDFVKAINGKLLISVSNCEGDHKNGERISLEQTKKIFDFSHNYGVDIDAIEFMNEPNMLEVSGTPKGYTAEDYAKDQDVVCKWVKENYPDCLLVGPCTTGDPSVILEGDKGMSAGIGNIFGCATTDELLKGTEIKLDVFSYHYYNGVSERLASMLPKAHWQPDEAHTDDYLNVAKVTAERHTSLRDKYVPNGQMWVTESGDAGGGGNTWASTYLDVFRTLNELGSFAKITDGVIFHNTLASSDYGFLQHGTFIPRPNYYAVLLWNKLMGQVVYDFEYEKKDMLHIYCHSRKDGQAGFVYLVINNSLTDFVNIELPCQTTVYNLSGGGNIRSEIMYLNGEPLVLDNNKNLPQITGKKHPPETITVLPGECAFLVCDI